MAKLRMMFGAIRMIAATTAIVCVAVPVAVVSALPGARVASACSMAETFAVSLEHLAEPDFNDTDSRLAQDYREFTGDDSATIEVLGVYVYETVYTVEPEGDFSRGSVNVAAEMWGQWPEDRTAKAIAPQDRSGEPPDNCGWGPAGRPMGTRVYTVITAVDGVDAVTDLRMDSADPDPVLTTAFGAPDLAERDRSFEEELIAQIDATRNRSTGLLVAAGASALLLASVVFFFTRRGSNPADEIAPGT